MMRMARKIRSAKMEIIAIPCFVRNFARADADSHRFLKNGVNRNYCLSLMTLIRKNHSLINMLI
jgi:hypothetical protein